MVCRVCTNSIKKTNKVSKFTSLSVLIFLISVTGIMYIMQVNRLATMGYEIKNREKSVEQLAKENELLKIKAAELKSMHNLELEKERMKMVKPDEVSYIEVENPMASLVDR